MNGNGQQPTADDAIRALHARGIDNGDQLLAYGTPDQILAACRRWDGRHGVGPGLLARWIRDQEFIDEPDPEPTVSERLRARFDEYAHRYPAGTTIRSPHYRSKLNPDWKPGDNPQQRILHEDCPGQVRLTAHERPVFVFECDTCSHQAACPVGGLPRLHEAVMGEVPF